MTLFFSIFCYKQKKKTELQLTLTIVSIINLKLHYLV